MILLAGIVVLGVIAVGLMALYSALCWSFYRDLQKQQEAAEAIQKRTVGSESAVVSDAPVPSARRLPAACDQCGSPSPEDLCGDCKEAENPA